MIPSAGVISAFATGARIQAQASVMSQALESPRQPETSTESLPTDDAARGWQQLDQAADSLLRAAAEVERQDRIGVLIDRLG
ncbi:MAG: hypothetical protein EA377_00280 [Phycisphaerales bacterium]|nr:MAG: hypothetical protein EA377_00280 [Phycisphaerales bacterium]